MNQVFYITLDPERALGVEDLLPSYHILYSEPSQIAVPIMDSGVDIKYFPQSSTRSFSTSTMLKNPSLINYIKTRSYQTPNVLVFKNDESIFRSASLCGFKLLNPDFKLGIELENKVNLAKFLESHQMPQPRFEIFDKFSDLSYENLAARYGHEFVVQFMFGHSGNSTFFVSSKSEFTELQKAYTLRSGRVCQKIQGPTYTLNACVTRLGVVVCGISEQITGIPELTPSSGGTVGNDFSQRHLNDHWRYQIIEIAMRFGELLAVRGHRGMFGLDLILDQETNKLYLIEANIRQVASATFASYLQRMHKIVPGMLWHIIELLGWDYTKPLDLLDDTVEEWVNDQITAFRLSNDKLGFNIEINVPIRASQLIFRNTKTHAVQLIEQFPAGIYRIRGRYPDSTSILENDEDDYVAVYRLREDGWSTLCLKSKGYNILQANDSNGFLILSKPEKAVIRPFEEMGRIQVLESAFGSVSDVYPSGWLMDVVRCIYENVREVKFMEA